MISSKAKLVLGQVDAELIEGATSYAYECFKCGRNKSFAVTKRDGLLLYHCHRASCNCSGIFTSRHSGSNPKNRVNFSPRLYSGKTLRLDQNWLSYFLGTYHLEEGDIHRAGWRYDVESARIIMPVLSPVGTVRGYSARTFSPQVTPKTLTYQEVDDIFLGWNLVQQKNPDVRHTVVVEDLISALRASKVANACCLLGTDLNGDEANEIARNSDIITLCLDRDATNKSFKYALRYQNVGNFSVLPLSKDIKDMLPKEYLEWSTEIGKIAESYCKSRSVA